MSEDKWCDHTCRECREGKHKACDGTAWCSLRDEPTECACVDCWGGAA